MVGTVQDSAEYYFNSSVSMELLLPDQPGGREHSVWRVRLAGRIIPDEEFARLQQSPLQHPVGGCGQRIFCSPNNESKTQHLQEVCPVSAYPMTPTSTVQSTELSQTTAFNGAISADMARDIFPFHIRCDVDFKIQFMGAQLQKVVPGISLGSRVSDFLVFSQPMGHGHGLALSVAQVFLLSNLQF